MRLAVWGSALLLSCGCLDEGRPLSEWEAEYAQRLAEEPQTTGMTSGVNNTAGMFEEICTQPGGANRTVNVENLLDEGVIVYFVDESCVAMERATIPSMTNTNIAGHVGQVYRFARESTPDVIILQHVFSLTSTRVVLE